MITQCARSATCLPWFAEGSPYLFPENIPLFLRAARDDISAMTVEPARKVFRNTSEAQEYPLPESCTPYVDADSLGFYLKPVLPLVFVRTKKGQPLLEARVALKYLRENSRRFASVLDAIERYAQRIFRPEIYAELQPRHRQLLSDVVQPYGAFTESHISLRAGLWVQTPSGVNTVIGPLINQESRLSILTGSVETDWHHFEFFVVVEFPEFDGQVLVLEPDAPLAQAHFVPRETQVQAEIRFSSDHPGADPSYWDGWEDLGEHLVRGGTRMMATRRGLASIHIGCPHCFVSVTAAAEEGVPEGHIVRRNFNPAYKLLKQLHRSGSIASRSSGS